jgi:hypothetical protein
VAAPAVRSRVRLRPDRPVVDHLVQSDRPAWVRSRSVVGRWAHRGRDRRHYREGVRHTRHWGQNVGGH